MPMGFEDILEIEKLNDVQVNVFGYQNGQLLPLKISSNESEFVMDLFLLYDNDHHHYVLITHLVKVVCYVRSKQIYKPLCNLDHSFSNILRHSVPSYTRVRMQRT